MDDIDSINCFSDSATGECTNTNDNSPENNSIDNSIPHSVEPSPTPQNQSDIIQGQTTYNTEPPLQTIPVRTRQVPQKFSDYIGLPSSFSNSSKCTINYPIQLADSTTHLLPLTKNSLQILCKYLNQPHIGK